MSTSHDEKVERFGYDPNAGLKFIGVVCTPRFTHHGMGDHHDWDIYFNEATKSIEVCFHGCNGTYYHGTEAADGTTNLPEELDEVFRQLRRGEYVHPSPWHG